MPLVVGAEVPTYLLLKELAVFGVVLVLIGRDDDGGGYLVVGVEV